jgi:hypothetical protein
VAETRSRWMRWIGARADARRMALAAGSVSLLGLALVMAACSSASLGVANDSNTLALTRIPWCDHPSIAFEDDSKVTHQILTDWNAVKGQLGFTPYLPSALPKGTCLVLAGGSIHDPVFGAHFRITYELPTGPLSFSEAPKQTDQTGAAGKVQCSKAATGPTPTPAPTPVPSSPPLAVCLGAIASTNVSIAAAQSTSDLESLFNSLSPNVDWVPEVASPPPPTPTATRAS